MSKRTDEPSPGGTDPDPTSPTQKQPTPSAIEIDKSQNIIVGHNGQIHWHQTLPKKTVVAALGTVVTLAVATIAIAVVTATGRSTTGTSAAPLVPSPTLSPIAAIAASDKWSPLHLDQVTQLHPIPGDKHFVLADKDKKDPAAFQKADVSDLYQNYHGIPVGIGITTFTLRNIINEPVSITRMAVQKQCSTPINGTVFQGWSQGNTELNAQIGVNLDVADPVVQEMFNDGEDKYRLAGPGYFDKQTVKLGPGDTETFTIGAFTQHYSCTFQLRVYVTTSRGTVYTDVAPAGEPFHVTAAAPETRSGYRYSGYEVLYSQNADWTWSPADPQANQ
ncbi:hypothetical protein [Nocardia vinacea]|uniref:hypothetical protein n=1 Tax=Nocardia vinacea TaxID=96468 RepID=UPI00059415D3|nr:hypothetical protein [Nocardia vinacea]